MNLYIEHCSDAVLADYERSWKLQGFRYVTKQSEKDLLPKEYMKTSFHGDQNSFYGPITWVLTRRDS